MTSTTAPVDLVSSTAPASVSPSASGEVETPIKSRSFDWLTGTFHEVEGEARALSEGDIREVDTDGPAFASAILRRLPKITEFREGAVRHNFPLWPFDKVEGYAVVARDANAATRQPRKANPADKALLVKSTGFIATCGSEIGLLISRGWVPANALLGLPTRTSFRNNGVRMMRHARILEQHLPQLIALQSKVTAEDIAYYIAVAEQLSALGAERQLAEVTETDDMAARTFTLLDMAVDELRAALTYLLWRTPEKIDAVLPRKPKKPSTSKAKKMKAAEEKTPSEKAADDNDAANGKEPVPTKRASDNAAAPKKEDKAAE